MYLPDHEIEDAIASGHLGVDPYDPAMVQPASIDVRLHRRFLVLRDSRRGLDPDSETGKWKPVEVPPRGESFRIHPGEFVLACTWERVTMPRDMLARLEGKSSLGRLAVRVHSTAGFIDPGFSGRITLELSLDSGLSVDLWPGMKVGQLSIARLSSPSQRPYGSREAGSHYQGQDWPEPSRSPERFTCGLPDEVPA